MKDRIREQALWVFRLTLRDYQHLIVEERNLERTQTNRFALLHLIGVLHRNILLYNRYSTLVWYTRGPIPLNWRQDLEDWDRIFPARELSVSAYDWEDIPLPPGWP